MLVPVATPTIIIVFFLSSITTIVFCWSVAFVYVDARLLGTEWLFFYCIPLLVPVMMMTMMMMMGAVVVVVAVLIIIYIACRDFPLIPVVDRFCEQNPNPQPLGLGFRV